MDKKQEELGKLYALRAGLSLISQKCDDININRENFERKEPIINKKLQECESNLYSPSILYVKNEEFKTDDERQKYYTAFEMDNEYVLRLKNLFVRSEEIISAEKELFSIDKKYLQIMKKIKLMIVLSVLLSLISIIFAVVINPFFLILFVLCVVVIISCICIRNIKKKYIKYSSNSYNELLNKEVLKYFHKADVISDYKLVKEEKEKLKECYNQNEILLKNEISNYKEILLNNSVGLLDIRDWENLDLVIYYYETGRADSIKEALQLVDMERHNNALIEAIGIATNEICRSIQSVGKVMIEGFNLLSSQFSEISSNQVLTNALLAKANVSSKQMVEQMKTLNNKIKSA